MNTQIKLGEIILSKEEVNQLLIFLFKVGYINYEEDMPIHDIIRRLENAKEQGESQ